MKINWNTLASVVAAVCGLAMITIIPFAQSWLKLTLDNQHAQISQEVAGVYEKQAAHDADIAKIANATDKLQQKAADTDLQVQHLKDVVENKQTTNKKNYEN